MPPEMLSVSPREIAKRNEVVNSLNPFVKKQLHLLLDPATAWQPSDILIPGHEDEIRREAARIPNSLLIALVGNTITEEGLPLFTSAIASYPSGRDITGRDDIPWLVWKRGWTSEEHRHEILSHGYLNNVPASDMKAVERDVQRYITRGFSPGGKLEDSYASNVYVSWQELATQISHKNVSDRARQVGAPILARAAGVMAGDEGRHGMFYVPIVGEIIKEDPEGAMVSLWHVIDYGIDMPGLNMENFAAFTDVSSAIGIYGIQDYLDIYKRLITTWDIEHVSVDGEAGEAQEKILQKYKVLSRLSQRHQLQQINEIDSAWTKGKSTFLLNGQIELVSR